MRAVLFTLSFALSTAAFAEESIVAPPPTPAPSAGPTKSAAEGFCGEVIAPAKDLIARYAHDGKFKKVYDSAEYTAYADDEKNPTVMYTFTVQGAAHPAAVCRRVVKEGDSAVIKMSIVCDGEKEACKKLSNDFNVMTAQMQAEVDNKIKAGGK